MKVQSKSALIAGSLGLTGHALISPNWLGGRDGAEELWAGMLTALLVAPSLLGFCSAFFPNPSVRAAALVAASVSSFSPLILFLMVLIVGIPFYLPGAVGLIIAALMNCFAMRRKIAALISAAAGLLAGIAVYAAWWPMLRAYDSCLTSTPLPPYPNGVPAVDCHGGLAMTDLATGGVLLAGAACLLCLTTLLKDSDDGRGQATQAWQAV